jgi:hypothetical protein
MKKCDCLTYCGDDPLIQGKKAKPCAMLQRSIDARRDRPLVVDRLRLISETMPPQEATILKRAAELLAGADIG